MTNLGLNNLDSRMHCNERSLRQPDPETGDLSVQHHDITGGNQGMRGILDSNVLKWWITRGLSC